MSDITNQELYNKLQEFMQVYRPTVNTQARFTEILVKGEVIYRLDKSNKNITNKVNIR
jgi:hypothetical protein